VTQLPRPAPPPREPLDFEALAFERIGFDLELAPEGPGPRSREFRTFSRRDFTESSAPPTLPVL
jgi:hypothetical protein